MLRITTFFWLDISRGVLLVMLRGIFKLVNAMSSIIDMHLYNIIFFASFSVSRVGRALPCSLQLMPDADVYLFYDVLSIHCRCSSTNLPFLFVFGCHAFMLNDAKAMISPLMVDWAHTKSLISQSINQPERLSSCHFLMCLSLNLSPFLWFQSVSH